MATLFEAYTTERRCYAPVQYILFIFKKNVFRVGHNGNRRGWLEMLLALALIGRGGD